MTAIKTLIESFKGWKILVFMTGMIGGRTGRRAGRPVVRVLDGRKSVKTRELRQTRLV